MIAYLCYSFVFLFISIFQGGFAEDKAKSIKCFICNTAFPTDDFSEEDCRNPTSNPKLKPKECTVDTLNSIATTWGSVKWNWREFSPDTPISEQGSHSYVFGEYPKSGYELKCMKEFLDKKSFHLKPWLKHKPDDFTQIIRFCEYQPKNCTEKCDTKKENGCFACCSSDGCNNAFGIASDALIILLSALYAIIFGRT